jgi:Ankyrin repeats (3 copies)
VPFKSVDSVGHTPLHSAVRSGSEEAVRALIEVNSDALKIKTIYGDTPLHLACHRNVAFVGEIAKLTCEKATQHGSHISPLLIRNRSDETPISIAMSELKTQHGQCYSLGQDIDYSQLAKLIKILYYGTEGFEEGGLVVACLALHRQGARLDPSFIRRVLVDHPEELRIPDNEGNYPLHLEASIPIEKMTLLDCDAACNCGRAACHSRASILKTMLDIFPEAAKYTNKNGDSVLSLIIKNGRPWNPTFAFIVRANPAALHFIENHELMPQVIARIGNGCGADTLYSFLRARPSILIKRS